MHLLKYRDRRVDMPPSSVGIRGEYRLEVRQENGHTRWLTNWFSNNITDIGLNRMATSTSRNNACQVGSGNTAPQNSDVTLETHVAGTTNKADFGRNHSGTNGPTYWSSVWYRYDFNQGAVVGNISEVGIGTSGSAGTSLTSRELIRDANGDPTTLSILAQETLRVHYRVYHYAPTVDVAGQIMVSGNPVDYIARAAKAGTSAWSPFIFSNSTALCVLGDAVNCTGYTGNIGPLTDSPSNFSFTMSVQSNPSYVSGSYSRSATYHTGVGSARTMKSAEIWLGDAPVAENGGKFQFQFDPPLVKSATEEMTLDFLVSWDRYVAP